MERNRQKMGVGEKYLKDIVYGSIDGIITTFAVVSGVLGASLSSAIVIILGLANLFADGISMAIGNYLSTKSEIEKIRKSRKKHKRNIEDNPEEEKEELREMIEKSGLDGGDIDNFVNKVVSNKKAWENILISSEYGEYIKKTDPKKTAFATFSSFVIAGFLPLLAFVVNAVFGLFEGFVFETAIILTAIALFSVGTMKASVVDKGALRSGIETFLIGGVAAAVAFGVGFLLRNFAG